MEAAALKELRSLVEEASGKILDGKDGRQYTTVATYRLERKEPAPETLLLHTLTGFAEYVKAVSKLDLGDTPIVAHVLSHTRVELRGVLSRGWDKQRFCYVAAGYEELFGGKDDGKFNFGSFYDLEKFIVSLQSMFSETTVRADLLKILGNITEEAVRNQADDGTTQTVTTRAGIVRKSETSLPNPLHLKPFRTFREVQQPESEFVLRVKQGQNSPLVAALFEADGGAWRLDAIRFIADWLKHALPDLTVIA